MSKYTVKVYEGDYRDRQEAANRDGAICYYEQHCNSLAYDDPDTQKDNPVLAIVAHNASKRSKAWGQQWADRTAHLYRNIAPRTELRSEVIQRAKFKRGDYNLRFTAMPAILAEPGFLSDLRQATILLDPHFRERLAHEAVKSIEAAFPDGGLIALSVGHKQASKPFDRGAPITKNVPNPEGWAEWDVSNDIVKRMVTIIRANALAAPINPDDPFHNALRVQWEPLPIATRLPCPHCRGQVRIKLEGK